MNIVETIRQQTRPFLDKTAIVEGERTITYRALLDQIAALRPLLGARGIGAGQRIAFRCRDGIDYVIGALALLDCGAAVVPVPDSLTPDEVEETLERIDVHGTLIHAELAPEESQKGLQGPQRQQGQQEQQGHTAPQPLHPTSHIPHPTFLWLPRGLRGPCRADPALDRRCRDLGTAFIRFSSGTTGTSKGVVLSHRAILERTDAANEGLGITDHDVILWVLGMSHHFVVSILLFLRRAATIIVANQNFPFSVLEAAERFPITFIYASPVHYFLLGASDAVSPQALANVRLAISTAMKMPPDVGAQFTQKFGIVPGEAYGIIEVGLPFINTDADPAARNSVGPILPAYELKIADADGQGVGEVLLRGKGMFDAYFSPWRLREECLRDGWFDTGDIGRLDECGRLCLLGRSKTVIVCAGMKVFPEEVEEVINAIPGVHGSLVSGRPHPQFGQVPIAQVVLNGNVSNPAELLGELRAHCCRRLSSYKVPMEFTQVEALPHTPSGKLARAGQQGGSS